MDDMETPKGQMIIKTGNHSVSGNGRMLIKCNIMGVLQNFQFATRPFL